MPDNLKKGWSRVAFGEVVQLCRERAGDPAADGFERYVGLDHLEPGDLKIRRWGNVADGTTFTNVFRAGQVLFGKRRAYQRKVAVADFDGICSGDIYVFEPKNDKLLSELLPFICQTDGFFEHAIGTSAGSLSPRTNWDSLASYEFPLPPIEEQRQISYMLLMAESVAEAQRQLLEAEQTVGLSLFWESTARSKAAPVALGSVLLEGPRNGCSASESGMPTGHWVLALSALTRWGYRPGELKPVVKSGAMAAAVLRKGDLVISRSNTRELVGLPGVYDEERSDVSWPDTMMRLSPDPARLRTGFLELFLRCPAGRSQVQSFAAGTSASMKKINGTNVKKIQVPLPHLDVQDTILGKMKTFRTAHVALQRRMTDMVGIRQQLLLQSLGNGVMEEVCPSPNPTR